MMERAISEKNIVPVKTIKLWTQGMQVSAQGLGCLGMSFSYGSPKPVAEMVNLVRHSILKGITFLDTSDVYGPFTNEILLGKTAVLYNRRLSSVLSVKDGYRTKVQIATKFGVYFTSDGTPAIRGDPAYVRECCEASLMRLDVSYIDLYYQHRVDTSVPIDITMREMKKLVEEGKVKYIGLSEVCASTIRRAHAVHPLTAVQMEWSLWTRDVEEEIIPTCRELGIGIVPFSPLGRGFFSFSGGLKLISSLEDGDYRKKLPRFQAGNVEENELLLEKVGKVARGKGCTNAQVALAWVHGRGDDVCPIPGTTKMKNLEENIVALGVILTREEEGELDSIALEVKGDRYEADVPTWKLSLTPPMPSSTTLP